MLELVVPGGDYFDETAGEFQTTEPTVLRLEHSLAALADWESKWKQPFLTLENRTPEMVKDYLRCMAGGYLPDDTGKPTGDNRIYWRPTHSNHLQRRRIISDESDYV